MKDGMTHLAYKAEHVVDLDSRMILGAEIITPADMHDTKSLEDSLHKAQIHLEAAGSEIEIRDVAADKCYQSTEALTELSEHMNYRSHIPEPKSLNSRNWSKTTLKQRRAVLANRQRAKGNKGRKLQRMRSEQVERSFAHVLETRGDRRSRLPGIEKIQKRYFLMTAACNLWLVMRMLFGIGTSRSLQGMMGAILACFKAHKTLWLALQNDWNAPCRPSGRFQRKFRNGLIEFRNRRVQIQIAISLPSC
jgi:hypothetical protein